MAFRAFVASVPFMLLAILLSLSGGLLAIFWTDIYAHIVASSLRLKPDGIRFLMWKDTPIPDYIEFFFFNWTNPEEILEEGKKPNFQEVGPYRFLETRLKTDIVWNDNDTISYRQERRWFFDPENSNGSLTDTITTMNIIALSAAYELRHWNYFLLFPVSQVLKRSSIAVSHPVSEFLFDGYRDPLIGLVKVINIFDHAIQMPFDKFGWFYARNASRLVDGVFNMATGASDLSQTGVMKQWNYRNRTEHYPGACGEVKGYTGEVFPPQRRKNETLDIYFHDICRRLHFDFSGEALVGDIPSYQYTASPMNLDNGTLDPGNACYCGDNCLPSGVVNMSACEFGAPTFFSYPHFYQADPYYVDHVGGLKPDREKHSFRISLEPTTGIPLEVLVRLQINLFVQPYEAISLFAELPELFFPMVWFEQRITLSPELSTAVQYLLLASPLGCAAAVVTCAAGLAMLAAVAGSRWCRRHGPVDEQKEVEAISPLMTDNRTSAIADTLLLRSHLRQ